MPISRTVSGLLTELACDEYTAPYGGSEGEAWQGNGEGVIFQDEDASDKQEGAASLKYNAEQAYYPNGTSHGWFTNANVVQHPGARLHIWHKSQPESGCTTTWALQAYVHLDYPPYIQLSDIITKAGSESWTLKKATLPDNLASEPPWNYHLIRSYYAYSGNYDKKTYEWIDHLVVSTTQYLTVTGLTPGQKVKIYRSTDNTLLDTQTCAGGATQVVFDIDAQDYPIYFYFKVYATDGSTLIETTPNYRMCGGDTWDWVAPAGTLDVSSTAFIIYRSAAVATPKSATVTATLKTPAGAPYPGATTYFTTGRGSVSPTSAVTNGSGQASTTLTSDTHGIAVVKANWPGDASVPAAVGFRTHHVFYEGEDGDVNKKFQLYVEGVELSYSSGTYVLSNSTDPQEWSAQIPEWDDMIIERGLVGIYRKGIKEYSGVLLTIGRPMNDNPRIVIGGIDSKALLSDRVITLKDYSTKTLAYIAADLLASYVCGITLGARGDYPTSFSITFADEYLVDGIAHLCDVLGWLYRINADRTLDIKPSFGATKAVTFEQGVNFFQGNNDKNLTQVCNSLRMRGNETLESTQTNSSSIDAIGFVEGIAFEKSITVQATLDMAAVAELDRRVNGAVQIAGAVLDDYDVGSWGVDDWITLTASENDLSGTYKVVRITRDMKDPNYAQIELQNPAAVRLADIVARIKRQLKDLSAKTAI
jgi:hypothetical protein